MKNFAPDGQAANNRAWVFTHALGTCLRSSVPSPLARDMGVCAAAKLSVPTATMVIAPRIALSKYQDMTRLAATGGKASGSHPAWDPV